MRYSRLLSDRCFLNKREAVSDPRSLDSPFAAGSLAEYLSTYSRTIPDVGEVSGLRILNCVAPV